MAAVALAAVAPDDGRLRDAASALTSGRVEQARLMVTEAVRNGVRGKALDRILADLAAVQGRHAEALVRYQALLRLERADPDLLVSAAATAWKLRQPKLASSYAARATALPGAGWRAWNIVAMVSDLEGRWSDSDEAYARAMAIAPGRAELLNNQGWSHLLRGEWETALSILEQAFAANPSLPRLANNLEFARAGLAEDLPQRRPGERDDLWAARLNDAGVAAEMRDDRKRALAAFTRAVEVRSEWFERADNNLRKLQVGDR